MTDDPTPQVKVAIARRILARNGCESQVAGHVSMRALGEEAFWVTPFQYFDETVPDDVAKVTFDLQTVDGDLDASPAIQFHSAIYERRPDIQAVIHTHSFWVSVFVTTRRLIGMYNVESVLFHDDQAFYEDDGTLPPVPGDRLAATLGDSKHVLLMKNHGAIVTAGTIEEATVKAFVLERCARLQIQAEAISGTEFPLAYVLQTQPAYEKYFLPQMWDANVRRLRAAHPELFERLPIGG